MKFLVLVVAFVMGIAFAASQARAQTTVKVGDTGDVFPVYWVINCESQLQHFRGVVLLSGPPGLTLSLREQNVRAARQNCPTPVPGAMVVVSAAAGAKSGKIQFKVRYGLKDGSSTESDHTREITVIP